MARQITVEIVGDPRNLEGAFGRANKATESFASKMDSVGQKMTNVGQKMSLFVTAPLVLLGNQAVNVASDLVESWSFLERTSGSAFGKVKANIEGLDPAYGITERAATQFTAQLMTQLEQLGYTEDAAADVSDSVIKMAGDWASAMNIDPVQFLDAVQASLRGEYDSLQRMIPTINAAAVEHEALAMSGKTAAKELTAEEKAMATMNIIARDSVAVTGDAVATQDTLAGQLRVTRVEYEKMQSQVGEKLLPVKLKLVQIAGSLIDRFTSLSPRAQNVALAFAGVAAATGPVLIGIGSVLRATASMIEHGPKVASKLSTMSTSFANLGKAAFTSAANVAKAAASLAASAARAAAATVASVARQVAAWTLLGARALAQAARVAAAWLIAMGPIALVVAAVVGVVALIVKNWDTIKRVTVQLWESVKRATSAAWNWIKRSVSDAIRFVTNLFLNFTGPGLIIKHWTTIRTATVSAFNAVVSFIAGVPGRIISSLSALGRGLASTARSAWDSFRNATASGANAVASYIASLPRRFVGALGNVGSLLYGAGRDLIEGFLRGVRAMAGRVVSAVTAPISTAIREANRLLGSRSPSRKFAQIGRTIPQGVAVGIMDEAGKVSRAAESMFADAMSAPRTPAFAGAAVGAGSGLGFAGMPDVNVEVHIHGNADAATVRDGAHDGVVEAFRELVREARMR